MLANGPVAEPPGEEVRGGVWGVEGHVSGPSPTPTHCQIVEMSTDKGASADDEFLSNVDEGLP